MRLLLIQSNFAAAKLSFNNHSGWQVHFRTFEPTRKNAKKKFLKKISRAFTRQSFLR